jgi:hypothetical protein
MLLHWWRFEFSNSRLRYRSLYDLTQLLEFLCNPRGGRSFRDLSLFGGLFEFKESSPVQHKSKIFEKATECRLYDQPKIRRKPVLGKLALRRSPTDFRLVIQPTFGSLFEDFWFVLYGQIIWFGDRYLNSIFFGLCNVDEREISFFQFQGLGIKAKKYQQFQSLKLQILKQKI